MAEISRRALTGAIAARCVAITNATGYVGQIGAMNGLPGVVGTPADPPTKTAGDLRVKPYFILFPGLGEPDTEPDVGDCFVDLQWPIQITAAAGDIDDLLAVVDRIQTRLHKWAPGPIGAGATRFYAGPLRVPAGYNPGSVLTDRTTTPYRLYVPLLYQLTAHN